MADATGNVTFIAKGVAKLSWTGITVTGKGITADVGLNFQSGLVQFALSSGVWASRSLQGSLDGTNYSTLNDINGTAITATANKIYQLGAIPQKLRVSDGTTVSGGSMDVTVIMKGAFS